MQIRNMRDLGAAVRAERRKLGLSQAALAERAGVGRDWVIGLEKGKPTAEVGLVLRALRSLGLAIQLGTAPRPTVDLDELLGEGPQEP